MQTIRFVDVLESSTEWLLPRYSALISRFFDVIHIKAHMVSILRVHSRILLKLQQLSNKPKLKAYKQLTLCSLFSNMSVYFHEPFFSFNDVSRLFEDALSPRSSSTRATTKNGSERSIARGFQPRLDVHESAEQNLVTATLELPGLKKEDINIDVQNGRLVVSGEQILSNDVEEKGYVHRERQYGRFSRTLPLPSGTKVGS